MPVLADIAIGAAVAKANRRVGRPTGEQPPDHLSKSNKYVHAVRSIIQLKKLFEARFSIASSAE
jgi:hypothetical protein